jgi:S1-C subfamily serine protease
MRERFRKRPTPRRPAAATAVTPVPPLVTGAAVVGRNPKTDLALIKINPKKDLPAVILRDPDALGAGDRAVATGDLLHPANMVTAGIVSAAGRINGAGTCGDFAQTDASIAPGNSGGLLFNLWGRGVGTNTAVAAMPAGERVTMTLLRDGKEQDLAVTMGRMPKEERS